MKFTVVCLLFVFSLVVCEEFYEVDVVGAIFDPETALSQLRELGYEVPLEKRVTNWPPIIENADCAGVLPSSCMSLFQDASRNTWFVKNCCAAKRHPIMKFKNVANVNLYEDCIASGLLMRILLFN